MHIKEKLVCKKKCRVNHKLGQNTVPKGLQLKQIRKTQVGEM